MIRSANPTLRDSTFDLPPAIGEASSTTMTLGGTVNKCFMMLGIVIFGAVMSWSSAQQGGISLTAIGGGIGSFILALVITFKKNWSPFLAPAYGLLQGLFLGGVSFMYEANFPGIVMQAVGLTFSVFMALLFAYKSGVIRATENFKLGMTAALGGIFIFYIVTMVIGMFGVDTSYFHSSSPLSIGISLVIVVVAALSLVMDFDFIENGAESGAPKYMEWYGAFGLTVTLAWLYIEMLRLLSKIQSRD